MTITTITPPSGLPVTLEQAKVHLKLEHDLEDELIVSLVSAATDHVQAVCSMALLGQTLRQHAHGPSPADVRVHGVGDIALDVWPVISIEAVTIYDATGTSQILSSTDYRLDRVGRPARVILSPGVAPLAMANGVEVDIYCGFGETGADVPSAIQRAILLLAGHWYEFRGHVRPVDQPVSIPTGIDALLAPYKRGRL